MFCARVSDASRNDEENNLSRRGPLHVPSGTYRALPVLPLPLIKERVCGTAKTGGHGHRPVQEGQNGKEAIVSSQYTRHNVMATLAFFLAGRGLESHIRTQLLSVPLPQNDCMTTVAWKQKKASSLNPCVRSCVSKKRTNAVPASRRPNGPQN
jgi:hypothetical protein